MYLVFQSYHYAHPAIRKPQHWRFIVVKTTVLPFQENGIPKSTTKTKCRYKGWYSKEAKAMQLQTLSMLKAVSNPFRLQHYLHMDLSFIDATLLFFI